MSDLYNTEGINIRFYPNLTNPPVKCCELIVYDNDGPEGYFCRVQADKSSDLIKFINLNYAKYVEEGSLNFTITNYWK